MNVSLGWRANRRYECPQRVECGDSGTPDCRGIGSVGDIQTNPLPLFLNLLFSEGFATQLDPAPVVNDAVQDGVRERGAPFVEGPAGNIGSPIERIHSQPPDFATRALGEAVPSNCPFMTVLVCFLEIC
jgi:hypothetical protein